MSETRFSAYIRLLRESKGLLQKDVAAKLGITRATYSHYENARLTPPADTFYRLGKMYNVSIEKLIRLSLLPLNPNNDPYFDPEDITLDDAIFADIENEPKAQDDYIEILQKISGIHSNFLIALNNKSNKDFAKELSSDDKELIYYYHKLPDNMQQVVLDLVQDIIVRGDNIKK